MIVTTTISYLPEQNFSNVSEETDTSELFYDNDREKNFIGWEQANLSLFSLQINARFNHFLVILEMSNSMKAREIWDNVTIFSMILEM